MRGRFISGRTAAVFLMVLLLGPPAYAALRTNEPAPLFSLPTLQGRQFDLSVALGQGRSGKSGGVVLSFFATWCGPCRKELPFLNGISAELQKKGISVVIVDLKEDTTVIRRFIEELKLDRVTVLVDKTGETASHYQVRLLPTTFCIGADGKIKDMIYGEVRSSNEFLLCAEKLLK